MRAAAGAAGTAAAAGGGQRHFRINREAHIGKVDAHALDLGQQILGNAEGKTFGFQLLVIILRLIQSQCQTGAASAAGCKKDADGLSVLIRKIGLKLLAGAGGKIQHGEPQFLSVFFRTMRKCVVFAGERSLRSVPAKYGRWNGLLPRCATAAGTIVFPHVRFLCPLVNEGGAFLPREKRIRWRCRKWPAATTSCGRIL